MIFGLTASALNAEAVKGIMSNFVFLKSAEKPRRLLSGSGYLNRRSVFLFVDAQSIRNYLYFEGDIFIKFPVHVHGIIPLRKNLYFPGVVVKGLGQGEHFTLF